MFEYLDHKEINRVHRLYLYGKRSIADSKNLCLVLEFTVNRPEYA